MIQKRIKISVDSEGHVKAETLGIHGQKCLDFVSILEDMLDAESLESKFTEDYAKLEVNLSEEQGISNES